MEADSDKIAQVDRFKEAAREIGADDHQERLNKRLNKLAKDKPKDEKSDGA